MDPEGEIRVDWAWRDIRSGTTVSFVSHNVGNIADQSPIRLLECQFVPLDPSSAHHQVRPAIDKRLFDPYSTSIIGWLALIRPDRRAKLDGRIVMKGDRILLRLVQFALQCVSLGRPGRDRVGQRFRKCK